MHRRREALRDLPGTLDSAFAQTLARIREQVQGSQALIILAWIHHTGPMPLNTLRYVLAIEPHHTQFHKDNLPETKTILDCCLGLVRLDTSQQASRTSHVKVTLVHSTLSVYFDSHPAILQESVYFLADVCLTYLLFDQRPGALSSVVDRVWLQLLHATENLTATTRDKAWRYLKFVNKRMDDQKLPFNTQGLPSHALNLANHEIPTYFAGRRSRGQTLIHTACMLGLDSFDSILDQIAEETTGPGAVLMNSPDILGISALGWTLLGHRELRLHPSRQDSYEQNIHRAERIIRNFPVLDPYKPLWDVGAFDAIRKLDADKKARRSNRIEYSASLPFLFFLSNYSYWPQAIGRCMSLMESHSNFNIWSALQLPWTSDHTSKGIAALADDGLVEQHDLRWVLVILEMDVRAAPDDLLNISAIHETNSSIATDTPWTGYSGLQLEPNTVFVRRQLVVLFEPGTRMPALVADDWQQDPVRTYCATRADITQTSSWNLDEILCRAILLRPQALLHVGTAADSVSVVKFVLSKFRVGPNLLDHNGIKPLQLAIKLKSLSTIPFLIKYDGIDLESLDDMGQSPLHFCAQRPKNYYDPVNTASIILSRCTSVLNLQDKAGKTALHYAVEHGDRRMINLLLRENRADVNIHDASGYTPLHMAIIKRDISICEIILEQSSGPEMSSDNIQIAWGLMMSAGASFILRLLRFVGKLVKHQAMLDGQNSLLLPLAGYGQGLLEMVQGESQNPKVTENDLDFMLALESTTCTSAASTITGAIAFGAGVALIDPGDAAKTIRAAIFKGAGNVAAYLLGKYEVDLDHLGEDGESALHLAVVYNASQAVQFLLGRSDIDLNAPEAEGYTSMHLAVVHKRQCILQMLLDSPRVAAGQIHDSSGATALILAVKHRFADAVPNLLAAHQRIPVTHLDRSGCSALHYAVMQEDVDTVRLLLGCPGLSATAPSQDGRTALAFAAMSAGMEMVSLLLETGDFDLNHRDGYGKTALDWAQMNPCAEVAKVLKCAS